MKRPMSGHEAPLFNGSYPEAGAPLAYVARQAIYDNDLNVMAYELLYRHTETATQALIVDDTQATLHVIVNMAIGIGLERLADNLPVHINYPCELLEEGLPPPFPASRVIIEVLEGVRATDRVLNTLRRFRARGFHIALDDFNPDKSDTNLLDCADTVKLDISEFSTPQLTGLAQTLKSLRLKLVAERVETAEQFKRCRAMGFDLYQGYFLQHPQTFSTRSMPAGHLAALRVIASLQGDEPTITKIEDLICQDPTLTYQLLRCVNSSYYGLSRRLESVRQAIVVLGLDKVRHLCSLIALSRIDNRPRSLITDAMVRAHMCEELGTLRATGQLPSLFMTGLFSTLDALTGLSMKELLEKLPLSTTISRALLSREGPLGAILDEVVAYERGLWTPRLFGSLTPMQIQAAYLEAVGKVQSAQALPSA
jgi:c-di-GMP phosphodiesterase